MRVAARKRFGQHFLHDPAVIRRIIAAIDPAPDDNLVEIGGGMGALTAPLLERVEALHVVEIDTRLATELERLSDSRARRPVGAARLVVHRADALDFDFTALATPERKLRIVGNLPYNISTPLLFRLLELKQSIRDMHVMLQKEVVTRMTAGPGSKDYGRLTVMLAAWADIERCFDIGPGAFAPAPKVWSTFVRIVPRTSPRFVIADAAQFASLVARLFSMRRKTIGRSLKGRATAPAIAAAGIDPRARPEDLAPAEFARLAELCE
jgi:16S rRNA (adenine1518-N6/adenine1519-N6)-dimethyltransferase